MQIELMMKEINYVRKLLIALTTDISKMLTALPLSYRPCDPLRDDNDSK